jgi:hypothetical protein
MAAVTPTAEAGVTAAASNAVRKPDVLG